MRFKSVKSCLKHFNNFAFFIGWGVLGAWSFAQAQVMITPNNAGSISSPSLGGGTFYYLVNTSLPTGNAFGNFTPIDVTKFQVSDSAGSNAVEVVFSTNLANINPTSGQQAVVTIQVSGSGSGGNPVLAPIATVNGTPCYTGTPNVPTGVCQAYSSDGGYYYAAKFYPQTSSSIRIGFYPQDICSAYSRSQNTASGSSPTAGSSSQAAPGSFGNVNVGTASGCPQAGSLTSPPAGTPSVLQLTFQVRMAQDGNQTTFPSSQALDQSSSPISFSFQVDVPTMNCPTTQAGLNAVYVLPGDTVVYLNTTAFGLSYAGTGDAPAVNLVVVGKDHNATPALSTTFNQSSYDLYQTVPLAGQNQSVSGFTNTTELYTANDHPYSLTFMIQDATGTFVIPQNQFNSCVLSSVRAAPIEGFFTSGAKSQCFIATAAYQSPDATPVLLLREFRDQVLLPTSWGRAFVNWYYQWSPPAAEWLTQHALFRLPVLFALSFVEILAWMFLTPSYLIVALFGVGWIGTYLVFSRRVSRRYNES